MRKILLGAVAATAIFVGSQGATHAATPDVTTATVRQSITPDATIIQNPLTDSTDLSNQAEHSGDD